MLTYTIMPDFAGAYGWTKLPDSPPCAGVGGMHANTYGWCGEHSISPGLEVAFADWQGEFESYAGEELGCRYDQFDWTSFHRRGLELTVRLKEELGDSAAIIYEKPFEDPGMDIEGRTEILPGGELRALPSRKELAALMEPLVDT